MNTVLSLDFSPTGKHFVSGAYDRSIRIYDVDGGHSKWALTGLSAFLTTAHREIYHTKRMQRIFCVLWSLDSKFLISGSDETNIRWAKRAHFWLPLHDHHSLLLQFMEIKCFRALRNQSRSVSDAGHAVALPVAADSERPTITAKSWRRSLNIILRSHVKVQGVG